MNAETCVDGSSGWALIAKVPGSMKRWGVHQQEFWPSPTLGMGSGRSVSSQTTEAAAVDAQHWSGVGIAAGAWPSMGDSKGSTCWACGEAPYLQCLVQAELGVVIIIIIVKGQGKTGIGSYCLMLCSNGDTLDVQGCAGTRDVKQGHSEPSWWMVT